MAASFLQKANKRLKAGKIGLTIYLRGDRLYLRGTLPPKPESGKVRSSQQVISTGLPNNPKGVSEAERRAKLIGAKLISGEFDWDEVRGRKKLGDSCGDWAEKLERKFWQSRAKTDSSIRTWRTYSQVLNKLPQDDLLSHEVLVNTVLSTEPDTRSRQRACMVLCQVAELAGIDQKAIANLAGTYSVKSVEPRDLPSNEQIIATWEAIEHPGWKWIFGMMATYGLRNHEVFGLDLTEFPTIYTHQETKTGRRFIFPVPKDWPERFNLAKKNLPKLKALREENPSNDWSLLGTKVSRYFFKSKVIGFNPYSLRHSYARNCFVNGLTPDLSATLMGHSLKLQMETYRAFWTQKTYKDAYEKAMKKTQSK